MLSIEVRSRKKLESLLDTLHRDNRRAFYETFYDYGGAFYVVFYRARR